MLRSGCIYRTDREETPLLQIVRLRNGSLCELWVFCTFEDSASNGWVVVYQGTLRECRRRASAWRCSLWFVF